jgi:hypothetical protein
VRAARTGKALGPADPGAADRDPQSAVSLGGVVDSGLDGLGVGHVGGDEVGADLAGQLLAALRVEVGDRHLGADLGQRPRRRRAQPRGSAGHQCSRSSRLHVGHPIRPILAFAGSQACN